MLDRINRLREELNNLMDKPGADPEEILKISRKLDKLIVEYYEKNKDNKRKV